MEAVTRSAGTVKWFSGQKGFGFIAPDGGGDDLFVHQTEIRAEGFRFLREGQRVEFVIESAEAGRTKAVDVVTLARSYHSDGGRGGGDGGGRRGRGRRGFDGRGSSDRFGGGEGRGGWRGGRSGSGRGGGGGGGECYNCGRVGHLARECYQGNDGAGGNRGYGGGRGGSGSGRACYNCGEEGHLARDCPNGQN